jgi:hypothetical protein
VHVREGAALAYRLLMRPSPLACLALASPFVPVGVLRSQLVAPLAVGFACVDGRERLSSRLVDPIGHSFPVRRVLAGPVLAGIAAGAVRVDVVARVIHRLAGLQRPDKLSEPVSVRRPAPEHPVVLLASRPSPWPAVIGAAHIYITGVIRQRIRQGRRRVGNCAPRLPSPLSSPFTLVVAILLPVPGVRLITLHASAAAAYRCAVQRVRADAVRHRPVALGTGAGRG